MNKITGSLLRVGIYAGTFDPVHAGHIAFALQAVEAAKLDHVYLMPEREPRGKAHVTHFAHRVAMIRRAARPHRQLDVLETEDRVFSTLTTLPRLQHRFPGATLVFICGSDVLAHMALWRHVERFLGATELCIGLREEETFAAVERVLSQLPVPPIKATIVQSYAAAVSSSKIRQAIRSKRHEKGLLRSVLLYAKQEWLYL
jgi:nicotinate-nucleotide adenylyltransferase